MNSIQFERYSNSAIIPSRQDQIHFTFKSDEDVTIEPNHTVSVLTGVGFTLPNNLGGLVYPMHGIYSIYYPRFMKNTGGQPLSMKIVNLGNEPQVIQRGQQIMRMLCQEIVQHDNFPFTKLDNDAIDPVRTESSAGWIIKSPRPYTVPPHDSVQIETGISTPGLDGYHSYIYPLHEFGVNSYLIEPNANDNIFMRLVNFTDDPIHVGIGDELGLLTLNEAIVMDIVEVDNLPRGPTSPIKRRG